MMQNSNKINLFLYTIAHFLVDGICAVTVLSNATEISPSVLISFLVIYNFLAFVTQPLAGYFIDKTARKKEIVLISFLMLATGFFLPTFQHLRVVLVGTANCLFHVAAGAEVLETSHNKMWPLGVFVSSGAVGLSLGTFYTNNVILHCIFIFLLLIVFTSVLLSGRNSVQILPSSKNTSVSWMVLAGLLFCITIRSFMGFAKAAPFENIVCLPLILSAFVFAGKFMGGFLCDWLSIKKVILIFIPLSALFYFIGEYHFILWGIGQFLINISMPITLYLIYQSMPNRPAFGFGLAASFLIPGLIISLLFSQMVLPLWIFGLIFIANFMLLLIGEKEKLKE